MDVLEQIIFLNKFFRNVGDFDARVFKVGGMSLEVKLFISNLENQAPGREMTLLATNLTISGDPFLIQKSPG